MEGKYGILYYEGTIGGRGPFWSPGKKMEPKDEGVYIYQEEWSTYNRPPKNSKNGK